LISPFSRRELGDLWRQVNDLPESVPADADARFGVESEVVVEAANESDGADLSVDEVRLDLALDSGDEFGVEARPDLVDVDPRDEVPTGPEAEVVIAADRLGLAPEDGPRWALPSVPEKYRLP